MNSREMSHHQPLMNHHSPFVHHETPPLFTSTHGAAMARPGRPGRSQLIVHGGSLGQQLRYLRVGLDMASMVAIAYSIKKKILPLLGHDILTIGAATTSVGPWYTYYS